VEQAQIPFVAALEEVQQTRGTVVELGLTMAVGRHIQSTEQSTFQFLLVLFRRIRAHGLDCHSGINVICQQMPYPSKTPKYLLLVVAYGSER
jgi:hypothetical protein